MLSRDRESGGISDRYWVKRGCKMRKTSHCPLPGMSPVITIGNCYHSSIANNNNTSKQQHPQSFPSPASCTPPCPFKIPSETLCIGCATSFSSLPPSSLPIFYRLQFAFHLTDLLNLVIMGKPRVFLSPTSIPIPANLKSL